MKFNAGNMIRMAFALVLACVLLGLPNSVSAVSNDNCGQSLPDNMRLRYGVGSGRHLEGDVYVMMIYLDDDVSSWTETECKDHIDSQVLPSLRFIEDNAEKWDVELCLHTDYQATCLDPDMPMKYDGVIEDFLDNRISEDILEQVAWSGGFSSAEVMHESIKQSVQSDEIVYMLIVDKPGNAYSLPYARKQGSAFVGVNKLEYAVVFSSYPEYYDPSDNISVAHELLHLFGAEDYYYPDGRLSLAEKYYPDDIMLCNSFALEQSSLGDYTAYTIGWTDIVPPVCQNPDWWAEYSGYHS